MNYEMYNNIDYFMKADAHKKGYIENIKHGKYNDLYGPYEGYLKGNLYKNLYEGYKNYNPGKINVNNEKEEALLNISQCAFASHELNLYLDNFPNDQEALHLFNQYSNKTDELIKDYERRYGPLTVSGTGDESIPFKWVENKWPWEG